MSKVLSIVIIFPLLFSACVNEIRITGIKKKLNAIVVTNESVGEIAQFSWTSNGNKILIASGSVKNELENWTGSSGTIFTQGEIVTDSSSCSSAFRSKSSGPLDLNGKCGITLSALSAWDARFFRLASTSTSGEVSLSSVYKIAKVPAGMIYFSKYNLTSIEASDILYDFAIDQYPASVKAGDTFGTPTVGYSSAETGLLENGEGRTPAALSQYAAQKGCLNRGTATGYSTFGTKFRLALEKEWMVAAKGCENGNSSCSSTYGLKNFGTLEWLDSTMVFDTSSKTMKRNSIENGDYSYDAVYSKQTYVTPIENNLGAEYSFFYNSLLGGNIVTIDLPVSSGAYGLRKNSTYHSDLTAVPTALPIAATYTRCVHLAPLQFSDVGETPFKLIGVYDHSRNTRTGVNPSPVTRQFFGNIVVSGNYAYTFSSDGSLNIIDISNKLSPSFAGAALSSSSNTQASINGIVKNQNYIYVSQPMTNNIAVFDVSNPTTPSFLRSIVVGTSPQTILINGNYLYVANKSSASISILSLADPTTPVLLRSISTTGGTQPTDLKIVNSYLAVTLYGSNAVQFFSLSDPSTPLSVTTIASSFATPILKGPYQMAVVGNYLVVGHSNCAWTWGSGTDRCGQSVIDVTTPSLPVVIANTLGGGTGGVNAVGKYVFGYSYYSTNEFRLLDLNDTLYPRVFSLKPKNTSSRVFSTIANTSVDTRSTDADGRISGSTYSNGYLYYLTGSEINYSRLYIYDLNSLYQ